MDTFKISELHYEAMEVLFVVYELPSFHITYRRKLISNELHSLEKHYFSKVIQLVNFLFPLNIGSELEAALRSEVKQHK